jgi:hypothetical protein
MFNKVMICKGSKLKGKTFCAGSTTCLTLEAKNTDGGCQMILLELQQTVQRHARRSQIPMA